MLRRLKSVSAIVIATWMFAWTAPAFAIDLQELEEQPYSASLELGALHLAQEGGAGVARESACLDRIFHLSDPAVVWEQRAITIEAVNSSLTIKSCVAGS